MIMVAAKELISKADLPQSPIRIALIPDEIGRVVHVSLPKIYKRISSIHSMAAQWAKLITKSFWPIGS